MAFNLLIELSSNKPDWKTLSSKMESFSANGIECFPIVLPGIEEKSCLGLSFLGRDISQDRIDSFTECLLYLLKEGHRVFELYAGTQLSTENVYSFVKEFIG
jgi:hypothetical protein